MAVDLGIQGLSVEPGSHMCAFYSEDSERREILVPFLQAARRAGDRCVCLVDGAEVESILQALEEETANRSDIAEDWLVLETSPEAYLVDGTFDADSMLAFWVSIFEDSKARGWSFVRIISEASWVIRDLPKVDEFLDYESKYNRISRSYPHVTICMYDLSVFGPELLITILKTHPQVLVGGVLHENPDYMEPEEFLASQNDHLPR